MYSEFIRLGSTRISHDNFKASFKLKFELELELLFKANCDGKTGREYLIAVVEASSLGYDYSYIKIQTDGAQYP